MGFIIELYLVGCVIAGLLIYNRYSNTMIAPEVKNQLILEALGSWYTVYKLLKED